MTDAYLLAGYLNTENFLGGRMKLDAAAAEAAMARELPRHSGLTQQRRQRHV